MANTILETLRAAHDFVDTPECAVSGDVRVRILGIDRAELTLAGVRAEIGIERGEDDAGVPGWYIFPQDLTAWDDSRPISDTERVEIARVLTAALQVMGYQVWNE